MNFNGVDGLDIIDNTMRGGAEGAISLVGNGLDNVLVEGNRITEKGSYGINLNTYGASENGKVTIRENTILRHASQQRRRRHGHHNSPPTPSARRSRS